MAYTGSNFGVVARLLHATHLRQAFRDSANAVASSLPLGKRSVLGESVPEAMVWILENYGPERFAEVFVGTFDTPEVIWNTEMRTHLIASVHHHLGDFPRQLQQHNGGAYKYCPLPTVAYPNLAKEVFCHNFYLRSIIDTARYPDWPIPDPIAFLKAVLERWKLELSKEASEGQASVKDACKVLEITGSFIEDAELRKNYRALARKFHPDRNPQGRDQFEEIQKAYEVLTAALAEAKAKGSAAASRVDVKEVGGTDDEKVLLLVASQVMLCERFPHDVGEYKYPAYPLLFRCLAAYAPPPPGTPYPDLDGRVLVACAKLAYASCLISPQNAQELIEEGGIAAMHSALCRCLLRVDGLTAPSASHELVAVGWLAHSLSGLAHFETARAAMVPMADSMAVCVSTLLTLPQSPQLAQVGAEHTPTSNTPLLSFSFPLASVLDRLMHTRR
jgi:DnaJ family protein C protein 13